MSRSREIDASLRLVVAVVSGSLVLSACSPRAATPVPATGPAPLTATDPPALTATVTSSPEPSPAPTEPALQLEVVEWHRWDEPVIHAWDVDRGWGYVYALVRNPYEFPVEVTGTPTARLLDGAGQFVVRSLGADLFDGSLMGIGQILPGETIGLHFCACGTVGTVVVPEWTTFELDLDLSQAAPVALSTDFQLEVRNVSQTGDASRASFAVAFTGRYIGSRPLNRIAVRLTVRDRQGNYLGSGEVGILGDRVPGGFASIEPGDSFGDPLPEVVSINLDPAYVNAALEYELHAVGSVAGP